MPALIFFALLSLAALWAMASDKSPLGARWFMALASLTLPPIGHYAAVTLSGQGHMHPDSPLSLIYIVCAYAALLAVCLYLIIQGARKEKGSLVALGLIISAITLLLLWFSYELSQVSWKPGG